MSTLTTPSTEGTTPTLADLVNAHPGAARILEAHGLDYCCGGRRPVTEACAAAGVNPEIVLAEIAGLAATPPPAWQEMSPAELVDHIESTHHAYLHAEFDRIEALATKVVGVHGQRHPELTDIHSAYRALRDDLEPHLLKEERVLFPMIRELSTATELPDFHCGTVRNPISMMMIEHDRAGDLLATLRSLTDAYSAPTDACASYRALFQALAEIEADTHLHVHKENNVLFPAVVALEEQVAARSEQR